jgi:hypothetical protein
MSAWLYINLVITFQILKLFWLIVKIPSIPNPPITMSFLSNLANLATFHKANPLMNSALQQQNQRQAMKINGGVKDGIGVQYLLKGSDEDLPLYSYCPLSLTKTSLCTPYFPDTQ